MVKLDIDVEKGGMKLDHQFLVDFGIDKNDILLAHEMRWEISHNLLRQWKEHFRLFSFQFSQEMDELKKINLRMYPTQEWTRNFFSFFLFHFDSNIILTRLSTFDFTSQITANFFLIR